MVATRRAPTTAEIRRACLKIQQGWTPVIERTRRTGSGAVQPFTLEDQAGLRALDTTPTVCLTVISVWRLHHSSATTGTSRLPMPTRGT